MEACFDLIEKYADEFEIISSIESPVEKEAGKT